MGVLFKILLVLCVVFEINAQSKRELAINNTKKVRQVNDIYVSDCGFVDDEVKTNVNNFVDLALKLFIEILAEANVSYIFSPSSVLLSIATLAEGSDNRKEIDDALGLPRDRCVKQRFYNYILSKEKPDLGFPFVRTGALIVEERLRLNENWFQHIPLQFQESVISAPIKRNPLSAAYAIRQITNVQLQSLNLTGNSVLLDSVEYTGLLQNSFSEILLKQPFYNDDGQQIGWVDMMRAKLRVRISYNDEIKLKAIELPIGSDGRYRIIFTQYVEKVDYVEKFRGLNMNIIKSSIERLKESKIPIEVQIPRFNLNTELDMRKVLEKIGVTSLWTNASVTRHVADIPLLPSSYIQRTNVFFDTVGLNSAQKPAPATTDTGKDTGLDPIIGNEFIANKVMHFGLFETEQFAPILLGSYGVPTYNL